MSFAIPYSCPLHRELNMPPLEVTPTPLKELKTTPQGATPAPHKELNMIPQGADGNYEPETVQAFLDNLLEEMHISDDEFGTEKNQVCKKVSVCSIYQWL